MKGLIILLIGLSFPLIGPSAPPPATKEPTTPFVIWSEKSDAATGILNNPFLVKDLILTGSERGVVIARRVADGKPVWRLEFGKRILHQPCDDDELVYVTSELGLTAVNIRDGKKAWDFGSAEMDGPSVVLKEKGLVYVAGTDGIMYAVETKSGKQRWTSDFITDAPKDPPGVDGARARMKYKARPTGMSSDGETLFLCVFDQSRVVAVDATTGKQKWSFQSGGWMYGPAAFGEKYVFAGSQDSFLYALDKTTGKEVWKFEVKGRVDRRPAVDDTHVFFASSNGTVYCADQTFGKKVWSFDSKEGTTRPSDVRLSSAHRGTLYLSGRDGYVFALSAATGDVKWRLRPENKDERFGTVTIIGTSILATSSPVERNMPGSAIVSIGVK